MISAFEMMAEKGKRRKECYRGSHGSVSDAKHPRMACRRGNGKEWGRLDPNRVHRKEKKKHL